MTRLASEVMRLRDPGITSVVIDYAPGDPNWRIVGFTGERGPGWEAGLAHVVLLLRNCRMVPDDPRMLET